mgnify:CR=1 FL=1
MLINAIGMFYKLANNYIFKFLTFLDNKGLSFNEGKIIDATFVEAPKQRNTKEENNQIKAGNGKDLWNPEEGDSKKGVDKRTLLIAEVL